MQYTPTAGRKAATAILAVITWFALALQLKLSVESTPTTGFTATKTVINFFSYFTILSNLLVALTLTIPLLSPHSTIGRFFSHPRVSSGIAVYIFIVGLVYNLVLRSIWSPAGWQLAADNLLHVVVPLAYVVLWAVITPRHVLYWKDLLPWLFFPALYLAYSLARGPVAHWYPYPFVDVDKFGYGKVALNSFFVLIAIITVGAGVIALNRRGIKQPETSKR
ncbi:MAG: Pr6Pr family membrane protein [Chitinophagaceae bacterium]|nr:Pr6Pr family membrane protein [Chitinophagaceae bacterium]